MAINKMLLPENYILGVASSVSAAKNYDIQDALIYAISNGFQGFQIFLNLNIINDVTLRKRIQLLCTNRNIHLVIHAPKALSWSIAQNERIVQVSKDLYPFDREVPIIYHYNERVDYEQALECMQYLNERDVIVCIENNFDLSEASIEESFYKYLHLLKRAKNMNVRFLPVFDIPRLFTKGYRMVSKSLKMVEAGLKILRSFDTSIIMHLIDFDFNSQGKEAWCPIGSGLIPYEKIFYLIKSNQIPVYMIILEYEDKINPIKSRLFLNKFFYSHDNARFFL